MKLYCIEYKARYCENGVGHAFVLAKSKAQAKKTIDPKTKEYVDAWVATEDDAVKYRGGLSLNDIREILERANGMITDVRKELRI